MIFREMTQKDIDFVAEHSVSRGIFHKQPEVIDYNYALEHEGKTLVIGGIRLINSTTAWGWIDLTDLAGSHIRTIYRVIKEWMEILCKDKGIKRLQAYIEPDFDEALRTIKHLGFEYESTMEKFIDDKDAWMYVKFFGD